MSTFNFIAGLVRRYGFGFSIGLSPQSFDQLANHHSKIGLRLARLLGSQAQRLGGFTAFLRCTTLQLGRQAELFRRLTAFLNQFALSFGFASSNFPQLPDVFRFLARLLGRNPQGFARLAQFLGEFTLFFGAVFMGPFQSCHRDFFPSWAHAVWPAWHPAKAHL